MKIRVAGHAGFCMGVKRALESLLKERGKEKGALYTYGPIIHNTQVLELLEKKGILVLPEEGPTQRGTVVLRAHGAPPEVKERLRAMGLRVVDGTCPKVRWVQGLVKKHIKLGDDVVILGEPHHPEVIGLVGHGMGKPHVIQGPDQINSLPRLRSPVLLAQTTQEREKFGETEKALRALYPDLKIHDTICDATKERQEEVRQLAQRVDAIVVVGGRHSGN
ncbi:MAG: 4-hydroxy-3-methylbut-2-enyl diphosphate reductase, partial [Desulfatiglandales bacterium]